MASCATHEYSRLCDRFARQRASDFANSSTSVFDVLEAGGTDLRAYPYQARRAVLQRMGHGER